MYLFKKTYNLSKKGIFLLLTFIVFGAVNCSSQKVDDNSTPELLAKTFLHILKTNDQELFKKHYNDPNEIFERLDTPNANWKSFQSEEEVKKNINDNYQIALSTAIEKIRTEFSKKGLNDWSNVEFHNFSFRLSPNERILSSGHLLFVNDDMAGELEDLRFYKTDSGQWKISSLPKVDNYVSKAWLGQ